VSSRAGAVPGPSTPARPAGPAHLQGRVDAMWRALVELAERRRAGVAPGDQRGRGLVVTDAELDAVVARAAHPADRTAAEGLALAAAELDAAALAAGGSPLTDVGAAFALNDLDIHLLVAAAAAELDDRLGPLLGWLHDDLQRSGVSVGLAFELAGVSLADGAARARLGPDSPLLRHGLVSLEGRAGPLGRRELRVDARVLGHLLGDGRDDPLVAPLRADAVAVDDDRAHLVARAIESDVWCTHVHERPGTSGWSVGAGALARLGLGTLAVDLRRTAPGAELADVVRRSVREATLTRRGLVLGPVEVLIAAEPAAAAWFVDPPCPVVLVGGRRWEPAWSSAFPPLQVDALPLDRAARDDLWARLVAELAPGEGGRRAGAADPEALVEAVAPFHVTAEQALQAATAANLVALATGTAVDAANLRARVREQSSRRLDAATRRVVPRVALDDLVLPDATATTMRRLITWASHRDRVLDDWAMGGKASRGRGMTALFAGKPGTGKTLAAEAVAGSLGLDMYVVDLATVIDKYIGETEKNLERVFTEAQGVDGVLLFDVADALFGKRSAVSDARDRYANVEVAYLLQRMEQFDGIAILSTNLRANLDEAFTRRLDFLVDFPVPDEAERRRLWDAHLAPPAPRADDLDLDFLARTFPVAGGDIRNVTLAAGYAAAVDGTPITMAHLVAALAAEQAKAGRLHVPEDFGDYAALLPARAPSGATAPSPSSSPSR
jgi:AAA+ superfamily predicted ATPase